MAKQNKNTFTFHAHSFKTAGPKSNNDSDVTFSIDEAFRQEIAPFSLLEPSTALKVTVEIES